MKSRLNSGCMPAHAGSWRHLLLILAIAMPGLAGAQDAPDVGLVNQMAGTVTYAQDGRAAQPVRPFMRVRQGDRLVLSAGAGLRIIYFSSGRQESWKGPASLRAGMVSSEVVSGGAPAVTSLPVGVPRTMTRVPDLVQGARLGGVVVRGGGRSRPAGPVPAEVGRARDLYKSMRSEAGADDVTPELFLLAVLQEYGYLEEMEPVAREMLSRQPDVPEVRELAKWVQTRVNTAR